MESAFVVGYSGVTGEALVDELIARKRFKRLVLIGRKPVPADGNSIPPGVEIRQIDFDEIDEYTDEFSGFDQGFCCLGGTYFEQGLEGYIKIDFYASLRIAKMAKKGGCKHFHLVSTTRSRKKGLLNYMMTKAILEEQMEKVKLPCLSIYKPGHLMGYQSHGRVMETTLQWLFWPLSWLWPNFITTPLDVLAKALYAGSLPSIDHGQRVIRYEIADLFQLAQSVN